MWKFGESPNITKSVGLGNPLTRVYDPSLQHLENMNKKTCDHQIVNGKVLAIPVNVPR